MPARLRGTARGVQTSSCELTEASFVNAIAFDLKVKTQDASRADFTGALLPRAKFTLVTLRDAIFRGADLTGASFSGSDLSGAIYTDGRVCKQGSTGECR